MRSRCCRVLRHASSCRRTGWISEEKSSVLMEPCCCFTLPSLPEAHLGRHTTLRKEHKRHLVSVDQFYEHLVRTPLAGDASLKIRDRLQRNRERLFTFPKFDGVPWNNNNAEHAVKAFAMLRHVIAGITTEKGIREYLVLFSICQTCKYMGMDFLHLLRSGETDIQIFSQRKFPRTRRGNPTTVPSPRTAQAPEV